MNFDLTLYLVTNSYDYSEETFLKRIEEALLEGVTIIQLREKDMSRKALYHRALKVKELTDKYNVPLLINDHVDICLAVEADGVHLGDSELPVSVVRHLLGQDKIIGVSVKTLERLREVEAEGADYIGVGAIAPTTTKKTSILNLDEIKAVTSSTDLPAVAIGGLNKENVSVLTGNGFKGMAFVSEIMKADNIQETVKELKQKVACVLEQTND